jgi:hypothetical protein
MLQIVSRFAHPLFFAVHRMPGLFLGCLIVLLFSALQAAEQGSIGGVIQQAGQGIAEHRIMLIRFGPDREVHRTPGQTDAQGHFVFDQLETAKHFEYFVGIQYDGQLYRSEPIVLQSGEARTGVIVEVAKNTTAQSPEESGQQAPLRAVSHHIVIVQQEDRLRVREILKILNATATPYLGKTLPRMAQHVSLYLPLPPGHVDFADVQGLSAEHLNYHASGLYYTAAIAPGEHLIAYTYSLSLRHALAVLLTERSLPTSRLEVLVDDTHLVVASDLKFEGRVSLDSHVFARFQGTNLPGASRAWLQFSPRGEVSAALQITAYALVVGIALAGIIVPLSTFWRKHPTAIRAAQPGPESKQDEDVSQWRLLHNIAHLDAQREAGTIDEVIYHQHRDAYKRQLYTLMQQRQETS